MNLIKVACTCAFLFLTSHQVVGQEDRATDHVSLFTSEFQNLDGSGKGYGVDLDTNGGCYDLSARAQKAKSIDTRGSCVKIFDTPGCMGMSRKVYMHDPRANQFSKVGFSEKVKSIRLCNFKAPQSIFLYPNANYQGTKYRVELKSDGACSSLPVINQNQASSVKPATSDICFVLFTNPDCTGKGVRFRGYGNAGQSDLEDVGIDDQVKSAHLCYGEDRKDAQFDCHTEP